MPSIKMKRHRRLRYQIRRCGEYAASDVFGVVAEDARLGTCTQLILDVYAVHAISHCEIIRSHRALMRSHYPELMIRRSHVFNAF